MAKITYTDPSDADAPKISWHGVVFRTMVPVEIDAVAKRELVADAKKHPYFTVEDEPEAQTAAPADELPPLPKAAKR